MAIREFSQLKSVETPKTLKKRSTLGKVGEFLAPTATKTIGKLREGEKVSAREAFGSVLEVGSFFIPVGVGARALGLGAKGLSRGARALKAKKKAKGVDDVAPSTFEDLGRKTKEVVGGLTQKAKTGATVGGISGTTFGAGRALGEEDKTIPQVIGEAAITGGLGIIGGGLIAPVTSLVGMSARGVAKLTSNAVKKVDKQLTPQTRAATVQAKTEAYISSHVEDQTSINNSLDKLMVRSRRVGGPNSKEGLIREAVEEGFLPKVEGTLDNQRPNIDELIDRRAFLATRLDEPLSKIKEKVKMSDLQKEAEALLMDRFDIDEKTFNQLALNFKRLRIKNPEDLSAVQINKIRKLMNKQSKTFKTEAHVVDAQYAIANATRAILDKIAPKTRGVNAEIGKLFRIEETLRVFHNKKIVVDEFTKAIGRYLGIIGISGPLAGIAGAATGIIGVASGAGLLIAGFAAQLGAKWLSKLVRESRFNEGAVKIIRNGINRDAKLKKELLIDATKADRKFLEEFFNPPSNLGGGR